MKENKLLVRCSKLSKLDTKSRSAISEIEQKKLDDYRLRETDGKKPLTDKQKEEVVKLIEKEKNKDAISDTAKTLAIQMYAKNEWNRDTNFATDATYKGNNLEDEALDIISIHDNELNFKNTERRQNDFIIGEIDINRLQQDRIVDIKNKENLVTFLKLVNGTSEESDDKVAKVYYSQMQGYMNLWDAKEAIIEHILQSVPEGMLWAKIQSSMWQNIKYDPLIIKNGVATSTTNWALELIDIIHLEDDYILESMRGLNMLTLDDDLDFKIIKDAKSTYLNYYFDNELFGYIPINRRRYRQVIKRNDDYMLFLEEQIIKLRKYYSTIKMPVFVS